jgi:hypothetical protein
MPAWIIPAAIAAGQLIGNLLGNRQQKKANMELAKFQAGANEAYLKNQLEYNTPQMQMLRFQEAGLNPNLIYGQGNPGNQAAPLSFPEIGRTDYQSMFNVLPLVNQSLMTQSQTSAIDAKTRKTHVETAIARLQERVLERNPLLDAGAYNAIIDSIKSAAEIKAADATMKGMTSEWFSGQKVFSIDGVDLHGPAGVVKLETELKLLEQRFSLGQADQKLKAEVLQSKEFQNALQEIQVKWMKDAEITPQHIYQFLQMLLLKLM